MTQHSKVARLFLFLTTTTAAALDPELLQGATPWRQPTDFPIPHEQPDLCLSDYGCDPDGVLNRQDWQAIDAWLTAQKASTPVVVVHNPCRDDTDNNDENDNAIPVQMAVAVTRKVSESENSKPKLAY